MSHWRGAKKLDSKVFEAEPRLCTVFFGSTSTLATKIGDARKTIMTNSGSSCKAGANRNLNLEKNLYEILSKMKQMGGSEEDKTRRFWPQDEGEDQQVPHPLISTQDGRHSVPCSWTDLREGDESVCLSPQKREQRNMKSSCLTRTTRCGKECQKNGKDTWWRKKKALPLDPKIPSCPKWLQFWRVTGLLFGINIKL